MYSKTLITSIFLILAVSSAAAQLEFRTEDPIDAYSDFNLNNNKITNLSNPESGSDAVTKSFAFSKLVNSGGDTLTGNLDLNGNNIEDIKNIQTDGNPIKITDGTNNLDIARFKEGGDIQILNGELEVLGSASADPRKKIYLGEGSKYGAQLIYDSRYNGDTTDNRFVLSTRSNGNRIDAITVKRGTGNIKALKNTEILGNTTINQTLKVNQGANSIKINGTNNDHAFQEWYINSNKPNQRSGWLGYGTSSNNILTINNQYGNKIKLKGGNVKIPNGNLNLNSNRITSLSDPINQQDAATKSFVQTYADNNDDVISDDQDLSIGTDPSNGGQTTIDIENGSSITFTDDFEPNSDASTKCGSDEVLEGGDNCVSNYEAGDDGDTSSTNEIQDLGEVVSQDNNADGNINVGDNNVAFSDTYISEQSGDHLLLQGRDPDQKLRLTDGGSLVYEEYHDGENVFEVDSISSTEAAVRIGQQGGNVDLDLNGNAINNIGGSTDIQSDGDINFNSGGSLVSVENLNVDSINSNKGSDPVDVTQGLDMTGTEIRNVATPDDSGDAATKGYVDSSTGSSLETVRFEFSGTSQVTENLNGEVQLVAGKVRAKHLDARYNSADATITLEYQDGSSDSFSVTSIGRSESKRFYPQNTSSSITEVRYNANQGNSDEDSTSGSISLMKIS